MIAAINAGTYDAIYWPPGNYAINGTPDAITASNIRIFGVGPGATRITQTDNVGTLFTFGAIGDNAARIQVDGLYLICTGSPTDYAINCVDMDDSVFRDIRIQDCQGFVLLGGIDNVAGVATTSACSRVHFYNCTGTIKTGSDLSWLRIRAGFGVKFIGCHLTAGVCASNAQGYVYIGGDFVTISGTDHGAQNDTMIFDDCIFFSNPGGGGTSGIPYGFKIDATKASVNNLWVANGTFDGTDTAGIWFRGDSTVDTARGFQFAENRFETAAKKIIDLSHAGNGSNYAEVFHFDHNTFFYGNASDSLVPITCDGGQLHGVVLDGNAIYQMQTPTGTQIVNMSCSYWSAIGNHFRKIASGGLAANYIFQTNAPSAGSNPDFFFTGGNVYDPPGTGFFNHMAYGGGASTNRRVLETDLTWPGH